MSAKSDIKTAVERLRERFCLEKFSLTAKTWRSLRVSGACGFQGKEPPEFSLLVHQADKALYCAKRAAATRSKCESSGILVS